ncbi:hypothetical protein Mgra_00003805, partial [Meloidogyne graminicola]
IWSEDPELNYIKSRTEFYLRQSTFYLSEKNFLSSYENLITSNEQLLIAYKNLNAAKEILLKSKTQTERSDDPLLLNEAYKTVFMSLDPNITQQCKNCKVLTFASRLSINAVNLTISSIYETECGQSSVCQLYKNHFLGNIIKITLIPISEDLVCNFASSACRDNTFVNELLEQGIVPCSFCVEGMTIIHEIIQPLGDLIGILKLGCNERKICLTYFHNLLTSLTSFLSSISKVEDISELCR